MITEKSIIKFLKRRYIINKKRYQGEWVLPRPLQGSFYLEARRQFKEKPETSRALRRIDIMNDVAKEKYGVKDNLLSISPFGKTYRLHVNKKVIKQMNDYQSEKKGK